MSDLVERLRALIAEQIEDNLDYIRLAEAKAGEPVECGGCGNSDPAKRCIGCMHDFVAPVDTAALQERVRVLEKALVQP